ncbi:hypothetical protein D9M69_548920 [compost metagenome]
MSRRYALLARSDSLRNTKEPVAVILLPLKWRPKVSGRSSKNQRHHRFDPAAQQWVLRLHPDQYSTLVCPEYRTTISQIENRIAIIAFFHFGQIGNLPTEGWNELRWLRDDSVGFTDFRLNDYNIGWGCCNTTAPSLFLYRSFPDYFVRRWSSRDALAKLEQILE